MSDTYDREWIKEMCSRLDLLEYASQTHDFKRVGYNSYAARCELHDDKDPSLIITPSKNLWYCHGCKRGGDIISWMMRYDGLSFKQSVSRIAELCGEPAPRTYTSGAVASMQELRRNCERESKPRVERKVMTPSFYEKFKAIPHEPHEWIDEGIDEDTLRRFDIRIDEKSNRIVYPVYDNNDNLIGAKGRTRFNNYRVLGISKYMNYTKVGTIDYFQGMHENRDAIIAADEIIVFEGLKSVMLLSSWGIDNAVSSETSRINNEQVELLINLGVKKVVIAFDNDVSLNQLMHVAQSLKRWMNVYIIRDNNDLLGEKDSPVDKGREVWERLYAERKRIV